MIILERNADGDIPPELKDRAHRTWADPAAFTRWCERYGISPEPAASTWAERFQRGRDSWARSAGVSGPTGLVPDPVYLEKLGVPHCGALDRMRARVEQKKPAALRS